VRLKRRKVISTVVTLVLVAIALLVVLRHGNEPRYDGERLSYWLALLAKHATTQDSPDFDKARNAISAIGTNALPFLMKWIQYEPPPWRRNLLKKLPTKLANNKTISGLVIGRTENRARDAMLGFGILGTNATSAIPLLEALMKDKSEPRSSGLAVLALGNLGVAAVPALTNALADPQQPSRYQIVYALTMGAEHAATNAVLPAIVNALSDQDTLVRQAATNVFNYLAPEGLTNAPAH